MERFIFEFAFRAGLIVLTTAIVLQVLRIRIAAAQHAVWSGVLIAMLALPIWMSWGPKAVLPVLPARGEPAAVINAAAPESLADPASEPLEVSVAPAMKPSGWNGTALFIGVYLVGAGALLLRLAMGTIRASRLTSGSCVGPVTVGLLRPRIILPESWREWPQVQLDAVLTHERAHARRRDPLFQWLALFNRAVFWFHPLSWWLERRMSALAEEACDAAVLERGHDPRDYSEYLLELARAVQRAGTRVNMVAMGMPGSYLPQRVKKIIDGARAPRISRIRMACAALACAIPAIVFAAGTLDHVQQVPQILPVPPFPAWSLPQPPVLLAQAPAPARSVPAVPAAARLEFEVASVKPFAPNPNGSFPLRTSGGPGTSDPSRISYINLTFKSLVMAAYNVESDSISGPAWLDSERYVIEANVPPGATKEQVSVMLRNLLADRFMLTLHRETKDGAVRELVLVKKGPKLKESLAPDGEPPPPCSPETGIFGTHQDKDCFIRGRSLPGPYPFTWMTPPIMHAVGANRPISALAEYLSFVLKGPVVDRTGLTGNWDYNLEFSMGPGSADPTDVPSDPAPDIFSAVRDQLGLKLESKRGPIEILVIDRVEKVPTEN